MRNMRNMRNPKNLVNFGVYFVSLLSWPFIYVLGVFKGIQRSTLILGFFCISILGYLSYDIWESRPSQNMDKEVSQETYEMIRIRAFGNPLYKRKVQQMLRDAVTPGIITNKEFFLLSAVASPKERLKEEVLGGN